MKEVDDQIWKGNVDDYNKILNVYPEITEATVGTIKTGLEEVIKKASLIPEKHKNSNWLDDSYIIIGKSYLYKKEFKTSLSFFKFVNSKSEDPNARHAALVFLMKTYIDSLDYQSAKTVSDFLEKKIKDGETFTEDNERDYQLTKAYYHQKLEAYDEMLPLLEKAVDKIKKKDVRARTHFIIGQLYQRQGKDSSAYKHYQIATKRNPPYELLFHSKLYMTQVSQGEGERADKKMDKYFKKLLADKKNLEYKDKIYFEMGNFEMKKNQVPDAISNYDKSIRVNSKNAPLKGLTYLKMGEIYFDRSIFEKSKLYYDSTVSVWDKNDKRYKSISNRQKVLAEFVEYQKTVQREDSLQKLAKLSKDQLDAFVDKVIADEKEQKIKAEKEKERQKELAKNQPANPDLPIQGVDESTFALSNTNAIPIGITEFRKIWGNRKLEDNWRRSQKDNTNAFNEPEENATTQNQEVKPEEEAVKKEEKVNKDIYYKDIPFTSAQMDSSNKKIERSLYKIGKIYDQKLEEPKRSIKTFDQLINRYPKSQYIAEAYYSIYLIDKKINDDKNAEVYKDKLLNEYPNSLYAKLLRNPNYRQDHQLANLRAHEKYKEAFSYYEDGHYKSVDSLVKVIRIEFPENDIEDKLTLLSIVSFGQTGSPLVYKTMLEKFIAENKNTPLKEKAKELLAASDNFINKKTASGDSVTTADVKFRKDPNIPHFLVTVLPKQVVKNKALNEFKNFSLSNSDGKKLKVEIKPFTDSTYLMVVSSFEEKFPAQVFINKLKEEKSFFQKNGYIEHPVFIINNHNYSLFLDSKNIQGYLKFYKENY